MQRIRVTWEESGVEHSEVVSGYYRFSDAVWRVALDYVEDPANAKLVSTVMLPEE